MLVKLCRGFWCRGNYYPPRTEGVILPDDIELPRDAQVWDGKQWNDVPRTDKGKVDQKAVEKATKEAEKAAKEARKDDPALFNEKGEPLPKSSRDETTKTGEPAEGNKPKDILKETQPKKTLDL